MSNVVNLPHPIDLVDFSHYALEVGGGVILPWGAATMSQRVLVAEDDNTTRFLIQEYCKDEPFDLTFAADGVEAMRLLKESPFDIVVTDVRLPGITG
jgi:PleD family two-component response regulator